ncbi:PEP-CTERM sorting domain-containing protein [Sphingomonas sp. MA1305]|uniref:PEPxxWA-CTERM sorting domain-containing protein n=1 Tax=Sphingomonas sp. MA1305 TaxID=2479204 RepID=UPI001E4EDD6F|nr:PEPxxWA-CTERM sorting domain-containing protein [Sphingomonas sp. MA1305]MBI0477209.1 PEP-CTERM sorting domain-containing protein [Sphingomonas sp. MA1305]
MRRRPVATLFVTLGASVLGIAGAGDLLSRASAEAPRTKTDAQARIDTPDTLLDARSPGARNYGWLVQNKPPRTGFDVGPAHERVLTSVRHRPGLPFSPGTTPAYTPYTPVVDGFDPTAPGPVEEALTDGNVPVGPGGVFVPGSPGIGVVSGPGGGTGGGGGTGNTPGTGGDPGGVVPSTPAVPEPGTWAMLVLGFFAVGATMRQRRPMLRHAAS